MEAKLRAREDCGSKGAKDCMDLLLVPRGSCMALAVAYDRAKTDQRAIFAAEGLDLDVIRNEAVDACTETGSVDCKIALADCL
jgi:hypothetical protein